MSSSSRVLLALVAASLSACGGGGGGGAGGGSGGNSPSPAPPTASISSITPAQRVVDEAVAFNGSGSGSAAGSLDYSWNFGDGTTGAGAAVTHTYSAHGNYGVSLTVRNAAGLSTTVTQSISVVARPAVPVITLSAQTAQPNSPIDVNVTGTDPQGSALSYSWDFGDGSTASGASASHAFTSEGTFTVRGTVTNALGLSRSASSTVQVAWPPIIPPGIIAYNARHILGQVFMADIAFVEPRGLAYTVSWDYGDGGKSTGAWGKHQYTALGQYTARVTVTNSAGQSVSAQMAIETLPAVAQPAPQNNVFQVYCAGAFCGAQSTTEYSGSGVGIWRYHNATASDATIDVALQGLSVGQSAFLVFSNGRAVAAGSLPSPAPASTPGGSSAAKLQRRAGVEVSAHERLQAQNRAMLESLGAVRKSADFAVRKATPAPAPLLRATAPAIGTQRTWRDLYLSTSVYNMEVAATCALSTGRNAIVWMDTDQVQRGEMPVSRIQSVAGFLCGPNGAYEKLVALHGDVYGTAASDPGMIHDAPGNLQDLHVAILGVPQATGWNGYFSSSNLFLNSANPDSNQAVSVVINGYYLAHTSDQDKTTHITLAHELKHLINWYQRGVVRGTYHSAWLEETSAMLAEELMGSELSVNNRTMSRVNGYSYSGGGIGYIDWTHPDGQSYNVGGSFGSALHRRYGLDFDKYLVDTCVDIGTPTASYDCVEDFIVAHGGAGFADEFARVGAATLGRMGMHVPLGFGFAPVPAGSFTLTPVSNASFEGGVDPPRSLGGVFGATTQSYDYDFMDVGQTTFVRNGVVVPAGTTLLVVVNEAAQ